MEKGRCNICQHEQAKQINKALIEGRTLQDIADEFNVHISSLSRHKPHLSDKIKAAAVINEAVEGQTLLQKVDDLLQRANGLLDKAENSQDIKTALIAIREVRSCLELLGKASGELSPDKILIQFAPVIDNLTLILRQEINDQQTLQRISERIEQLDVIDI